MAVVVEIGDDAVDVRFTGADRLWALSRGLRIPWERLVGAVLMSRQTAKAESPRLRLPGSDWPRSFPGGLRAGSYGWGAERQLWCVRRAPEVLVIRIDGRPYCRVVVEIADPAGTAAHIMSAARSRRDPG